MKELNELFVIEQWSAAAKRERLVAHWLDFGWVKGGCKPQATSPKGRQAGHPTRLFLPFISINSFTKLNEIDWEMKWKRGPRQTNEKTNQTQMKEENAALDWLVVGYGRWPSCSAPHHSKENNFLFRSAARPTLHFEFHSIGEAKTWRLIKKIS